MKIPVVRQISDQWKKERKLSGLSTVKHQTPYMDQSPQGPTDFHHGITAEGVLMSAEAAGGSMAKLVLRRGNDNVANIRVCELNRLQDLSHWARKQYLSTPFGRHSSSVDLEQITKEKKQIYWASEDCNLQEKLLSSIFQTGNKPQLPKHRISSPTGEAG